MPPVSTDWAAETDEDVTRPGGRSEHGVHGSRGALRRLTGDSRHRCGVLAQFFDLAAQTCTWTFAVNHGVALHGLGEDTTFDAAGLVMAILGGATIPLIQARTMGFTPTDVGCLVPAACLAPVGTCALFDLRSARSAQAGPVEIPTSQHPTDRDRAPGVVELVDAGPRRPTGAGRAPRDDRRHHLRGAAARPTRPVSSSRVVCSGIGPAVWSCSRPLTAPRPAPGCTTAVMVSSGLHRGRGARDAAATTGVLKTTPGTGTVGTWPGPDAGRRPGPTAGRPPRWPAQPPRAAPAPVPAVSQLLGSATAGVWRHRWCASRGCCGTDASPVVRATAGHHRP